MHSKQGLQVFVRCLYITPTESLLKVIENVFYITQYSLFIIEIFKFSYFSFSFSKDFRRS